MSIDECPTNKKWFTDITETGYSGPNKLLKESPMADQKKPNNPNQKNPNQQQQKPNPTKTPAQKPTTSKPSWK